MLSSPSLCIDIVNIFWVVNIFSLIAIIEWIPELRREFYLGVLRVDGSWSKLWNERASICQMGGCKNWEIRNRHGKVEGWEKTRRILLICSNVQGAVYGPLFWMDIRKSVTLTKMRRKTWSQRIVIKDYLFWRKYLAMLRIFDLVQFALQTFNLILSSPKLWVHIILVCVVTVNYVTIFIHFHNLNRRNIKITYSNGTLARIESLRELIIKKVQITKWKMTYNFEKLKFLLRIKLKG